MKENESMLIAIVKAEREYLSGLRQNYLEELKLLPEGYLCCENNRGTPRYYQRFPGGKRRYLPKREKALVDVLARKHFLHKSLPQIERNIDLLDRMIKGYRPYDPDTICGGGRPKFLSELSLVCRGKAPDQTEGDWESEPFVGNPKYPEHLIHITPRGERVRSKSEVVIASLLYTHHIPYRYEAELTVGEVTVYPDFTVRRPRDGKLVYWEHFGMTGDEGYGRNMEGKLRLYRENGILPWDNLITTYDTPEGNFDVQTVFAVIQAFLL